jgi:cephalosporin hydroxylase
VTAEAETESHRAEPATVGLQAAFERIGTLERSLIERDDELHWLRARSLSQERALQALLASGGLRLADRISALRHPRRDWSWPTRIRRALGAGGARPSPSSTTEAATEDAIINRFHGLWFRRHPVFAGAFAGIPTWQNPLDAWITQEIFCEVRPDLILETGSHKGGSAAFWALLLEVANPAGRVVSVDVNGERDPRVHELDVVRNRVEFMTGSSTDPAIVDEVARRAAGGNVLAILDSDHSVEHVFAELTAYAPLIGVGSYIIVQDVLAGPAVAIERFLGQDDRFEPDRTRERYMITNCAGGFLRRVK